MRKKWGFSVSGVVSILHFTLAGSLVVLRITAGDWLEECFENRESLEDIYGWTLGILVMPFGYLLEFFPSYGVESEGILGFATALFFFFGILALNSALVGHGLAGLGLWIYVTIRRAGLRLKRKRA